ncbi:unnamed protein product, partial [Symbiodinium necroappetens]
MVYGFSFAPLLVVFEVTCVASMSQHSGCDGSEQGTCRSQVVTDLPADHTDELAALQARRAMHVNYMVRAPQVPLSRDSAGIVETTGLVVVMFGVQPFWIMASAGQTCNSACSAFDTADDSFECGKDEMGAINSSQAISDLLVSLNGTCGFADNGNLFRSNAGSPFILVNGDCYYWDPDKLSQHLDGIWVWLSADPDGGWFTGATNNVPCDTVCNDNGYAECGEEEMAAINNTQAIVDLAWELGIVCTVNSGDPSRNNAGTPFLSGNKCYYWDPNTAASQVDCSSVNSANR